MNRALSDYRARIAKAITPDAFDGSYDGYPLSEQIAIQTAYERADRFIASGVLTEMGADLISEMREHKISDARIVDANWDRSQRYSAWNQGIENAILSVKKLFKVSDDNSF